jgi:hypothetical protein
MRVLEVQWSQALSFVCEVALSQFLIIASSVLRKKKVTFCYNLNFNQVDNVQFLLKLGVHINICHHYNGSQAVNT